MSVTGSLARTVEQRALADSVRQVLARHSPLPRVRDRTDHEVAFDRAGWLALAELDVLAAMLPDETGSASLAPSDLAGVLEASGRALYDGPLAAAIAIVAAASDPTDALVTATAAGHATATILPATTSLVVEDCRVDGTAQTALDAPAVDAFVIAAATGCVVVARTDALVRPVSAVDASRRFGDVRFDDAPARTLAADPVRLLDLYAVALCADGYGAAAAAFEAALTYANVREQFGQPIGRFQAVQHLLVNAFSELRLAQLSIVEALDSLEPVAVAAAVARCRSGLAGVTAAAIQVHGGIGYSWECDVQLFHKRCLAVQAMRPSAAAALDRLAAELIE